MRTSLAFAIASLAGTRHGITTTMAFLSTGIHRSPTRLWHRIHLTMSRVSVTTRSNTHQLFLHSSKSTTTRLYSSSTPQIVQIDKEQLEEIFDDIENGGREESGYIVMDVRNEDEIAFTGKLSPHVYTVPLPIIAQNQVFKLDEEKFEQMLGFPKPSFDETLVFTCKAGMRSMYAAQYAAAAGYENLVSYRGGADDWFSGRR